MAIHVRPLTPEDQPAAHELRQRTFLARGTAFDRTLDTDWYAPLERRLGAFEEDRLVGHLAAWDFQQHFGGAALPMAGIAAVAVAPHRRGRGAASALLRQALKDARQRGDVVSTLYPANTTLYRRQGWQTAGVRLVRTVPLASLAQLPRPSRTLDVRPAVLADLPAISAVHDSVMARATGTLSRPERHTGRAVSGREAHETYVVLRAGQVVGYIWWERVATAGGFTLAVHELLAVDVDALLAACALVSSWYPLLETSVTLVGSPSDPLLLLLDDGPPEFAVSVQHWMLRLVDVAQAFGRRGYPPAATGQVHLQIRDESAPWNDGPHVLTLDASRATLERGGAGTAQIDVRTLAAVYSGWLDVRQARRYGLLSASDADVDLLGAALTGPTPWMLSYF